MQSEGSSKAQLTDLARGLAGGALAVWLAAASLTGCAVVHPEGKPEGPSASCLGEDLDQLQACFNRFSEQHRVVAFLSPTCPYSRLALDGLSDALDEHCELDVRVLVVWIDELPEDGPQSARYAAMDLQDERVTFFHDARRRASLTLARNALPAAAVSRTLLCYAPGMEWSDEAPRPVRVAHQMGRIAPADYCAPEALASVLSDEWVRSGR